MEEFENRQDDLSQNENISPPEEELTPEEKRQKFSESYNKLKDFSKSIRVSKEGGGPFDYETRTVPDDEIEDVANEVTNLIENFDEETAEDAVELLHKLSRFAKSNGPDVENYKEVEQRVLSAISEKSEKIADLIDSPDDNLAEKSFSLMVQQLKTWDRDVFNKADKHLQDHIEFIAKEGVLPNHEDIRYLPGIEQADDILKMHPSAELRSKIEETLNSIFDNDTRGLQKLSLLYSSENNIARNIGRRVLSNKLEANFGLDTKDIFESWDRSSGSRQNDKENSVRSNIHTIVDLESENKGSTKYLYEEFGIRNFGRYPTEMLKRQYDHRDDKETPYGVIIYPDTDHNATFQTDAVAFKQLDRDIADRKRLRIHEAKSQFDLTRRMIKSRDKYGKADFGIIGGHGYSQGIQLGKDELTINSMFPRKSREEYAADQDSFYKSEPRPAAGRFLGEFFNPDPTIVLVSCSTAKGEDSFAQRISMLGATVVAPNEVASLSSMYYEETKDGKEKIVPMYALKGRPRVFKNGVEVSSDEYYSG